MEKITLIVCFCLIGVLHICFDTLFFSWPRKIKRRLVHQPLPLSLMHNACLLLLMYTYHIPVIDMLVIVLALFLCGSTTADSKSVARDNPMTNELASFWSKNASTIFDLTERDEKIAHWIS